MLIADEDSSTDGNQGLDDHEGQYEEAEYVDEYDKPSELSQEVFQETSNTENEDDDETTEHDTGKNEEYEGHFDD